MREEHSCRPRLRSVFSLRENDVFAQRVGGGSQFVCCLGRRAIGMNSDFRKVVTELRLVKSAFAGREWHSTRTGGPSGRFLCGLPLRPETVEIVLRDGRDRTRPALEIRD